MERTRTVKRGYVVFGESITLRWGVELSWGNRALEQERPDAVFAWPLLRRDLPDGQWSFLLCRQKWRLRS